MPTLVSVARDVVTANTVRLCEGWGQRDTISRPPERNNFSTTDSGRLSRYKPDVGSQPACKAHRDHRSASVRNAKQGPANSQNIRRIGVPLESPCTYALKLYELLRAARRYAEDSNGPQDVSHHERMPVMLG
jgi:hypothetical protein